MMNNRIDPVELSEEEEDFGLGKDIKAVIQANIQAGLNAMAETDLAQVSSPSSASTAPESASVSAPAYAACILLDSASIFGDAASSATLLQHSVCDTNCLDIAVEEDYESSGQPLVLPSVALNTPIAQYGIENTNIAAEVDANITQVTWEKLYYMSQFHRAMADQMEWQMQFMWPVDTQYSYPGDGGVGLGESITSTAISLEEGGTNDLVHGDVNTEGEEIPRSENRFENKRLRKEFFGALTAKKEVKYQ